MLFSTEMSLSIRFNHTAASRGHAHDAKLHVYAPAYMEYDSYSGMTLMNPTQSATVNSDENSLLFDFDVIIELLS